MAEKRHHGSRRSRSERMEDDLNRSSFRDAGDLAGWPSPERAPRTSRADSCEPQGAEPYCPGASSQPVVAIPVINQEEPPEGDVAKEGLLAAPSDLGGPAESTYVDERGGETEGLVYGAECGGPPPTKFRSSKVTDEEADARSEWRYQKPLRQTSRTSAYGDTCGRPSPGARGSTPRSSLDCRQGESQSTHVLQRIEGVMSRMEQQFAASTSAFASLAAHVAPSTPGEFISFHFHLELSKYCLCCSNFILTFFIVIKCPAYVFGLVHHVTKSIT
jgi:hypothetical protein